MSKKSKKKKMEKRDRKKDDVMIYVLDFSKMHESLKPMFENARKKLIDAV